jgi:hypothetical protein
VASGSRRGALGGSRSSWGAAMRRGALPSVRSSREPSGGSQSARLAAHTRTAGDRAQGYSIGASGRRIDLRVLGPRPITRMQPAVAPANSLAVPPAADPPPR